MIKAVIFDFFGVLIGEGFDITYRNAGGDPVKDRAYISNQLLLNNTGAISRIEFRDNIAKKLSMAPEEFAKKISDSEQLNTQLFNYIQKFIKPKYKTAILSNASSGAIDRRVDPELIDNCFDEVIVSADVGLIKPDPQIYEMAAGKLKVPVDECVFTDDSAKHVEAAKTTGMQAILFKNFEQMKAELEQKLAEG